MAPKRKLQEGSTQSQSKSSRRTPTTTPPPCSQDTSSDQSERNKHSNNHFQSIDNGHARDTRSRNTDDHRTSSRMASPVYRDDEHHNDEEIQRQLDEIEEERKRVIDETHPKVVERIKLLEEVCRRRTAASKKFRDLQIENIQSLYDYEIKQAHAKYEADAEEMKQAFATELALKIEALQNEKLAFERRSRGAASLRSAVIQPPVMGKRMEARIGHVPETVNVIQEHVTDNEARRDMQAIVNDLKTQANEYKENPKNPHAVVVELKNGTLNCGGFKYHPHQRIQVHSALSQQDFTGVIEAINEFSHWACESPGGEGDMGGELLVNLVDGSYARVLLSHLRTGRLRLNPLEEQAPASIFGNF